MSLAGGRDYLAIPGPSVMPDRVLRAMHRAAPNIYEGPLVDMVPTIIDRLKAVAGTRHHAAIYIANGHGVWEAALANILAPGGTVLVVGTGRFAHAWGDMAAGLGGRVETVDFGKRAPADPEQIAAVLRADTARRIKVVLGVHVDTSTSIRNDMGAIRGAIDAAGHPALFAADCICSLACDRVDMDGWGADVLVAACQKGLMTPPGLGFVFFNDKAAAARAGQQRVSRYWDWNPRVRPADFSDYFNGTAPTHHLFGLNEALDMLAEEGLGHVLGRHARMARAVWAALDAWGVGGPVELNVPVAANRCHAVTAVRISPQHGTRLREWVAANTGVTLGIGLGMVARDDPAWHGFFRIGHMGHMDAHMVLGVLAATEAGLQALDIPHGPGALAAAAAVIADR